MKDPLRSQPSKKGHVAEVRGSASNGWVDPCLSEKPAESNGPLGTYGQLINTMIGSGILSFPSVLAQVGLVYTVCSLMVFGAVVALSSCMMIEAGNELGVMDYSLIVEKCLGRRFRIANDLAVFVTNMGALMTYVNVIGSLGSMVCAYLQPHGFTWINTYPGFMVMFTLFICVPMNLKRAYGELTYISAVSSLLIWSAIFFVGIEGTTLSGEAHPIKLWPLGAVACIKNLGNFAYATSCQAVVCEAHLAMTPESKRSFNYMMVAAAVTGMSMLTAMAIVGYVAFGPNVQGNVMLSFQPGPISSIGFALVVVHLLMYIPNDFIIMRFYGMKMFGITDRQIPFVFYAILTLVLFAVPVAAMASVPPADVGGAFGLALDLSGDLPVGFQCFVLPGLVYLCLFRNFPRRRLMKVVAVVSLGIGALLSTLCPVIDIASFVSACSSEGGCSSY